MRTSIDKTEAAGLEAALSQYDAHNPDDPLPAEVVEHGSQRSRRAAYDYLKKRFKALQAGEYRWTDEHLCAAAAAEAFLRSNMSVIISADMDLRFIMKQCTDNLLAAYSQLTSLKETRQEDKDAVYLKREIETVERLRAEAPHNNVGDQLRVDLTGMSALEANFVRDGLLTESARYLKGTVTLFNWQTSLPVPYFFPAHIVRYAREVVVREHKIIKPD